MRQEELRCVLLVKAVEEADPEGTVIAPAERIAATREASRASRDTASPGGAIAPGALSGEPERMGVERARILFGKIVARHPFVDTIARVAGGPAWVTGALVAIGFLAGIALSALDGSRRISVFAPALLVVALWNLAVYAAVATGWISWRPSPLPPGSGPAQWIVNRGKGQLTRLVARSRRFNAALADALGRFAREWFELAKPLLVARATRAFHLSAAALGIGLIGGLYLRGIVLDYQAGWESTFLEAPQARAVLSVIYGPASWLTGIPIPDAAHLEAIRWKEGVGGERAAPWIHLLAATVALLIVLPRLALAMLSTAFILRWSHRAPVPPSLDAYFRATFGTHGGAIAPALVTVIPYAYEPSTAARAGLRTLLPMALGEGLTIDARAPIRYGDEEEFLLHLGDGGKADIQVLLFNLAATPEAENQGAVIAGLRDWIEKTQSPSRLLVLVDEGPYAARMAVDGGAPGRIPERRQAWEAFVASHGLSAYIANLDSVRPEPSPQREHVDGIRRALWQPRPA